MRSEVVNYEGSMLELEDVELPGGGWIRWAITWQGPDGTRYPVDQLEVEVFGGESVTALHEGDRYWRLTVSASDARPAREPARSQRRVERRSGVEIRARALVGGEMLLIARQFVAT